MSYRVKEIAFYELDEELSVINDYFCDTDDDALQCFIELCRANANRKCEIIPGGDWLLISRSVKTPILKMPVGKSFLCQSFKNVHDMVYSVILEQPEFPENVF